MAGRLVFIENKNEVSTIEQYILEDTVVIAMLPSVGIELKRRGIHSINTLSLFGVDGHSETLKHSKIL